MRTHALRAGIVTALVAAGLGAGVGSASADTPAGMADLGSAGFTKAGTTVTVPVLAPCSVDGATSASSPAVKKTGLAFGGGMSSCTTTVVDPETEETTTKSTATGKDFELSALVSAGGPRVRIRSYTVTCTATQGGTNSSWTFSGLTGIGSLPSPVPESYTKPIMKSNGTVLADAVFNLHDKPGDGSIALTMLRITFA
ncbi:MAG: hypothetical protein ACRD0P_37130, partial [Stackebrandtia sp.]